MHFFSAWLLSSFIVELKEKKNVEETIVKIQDSVLKCRPYLYSYFPLHARVLEILMQCKLTHKVLTVDQLCSAYVEVAGLDRAVLDRLLCVLNSWVSNSTINFSVVIHSFFA